MFPRSEYYSQTEVLKLYKVNADTYKRILTEKNIPTVNKQIDLGGYMATTIYVLKSDVHALGLTPR
jgi:hypothetical protein